MELPTSKPPPPCSSSSCSSSTSFSSSSPSQSPSTSFSSCFSSTHSSPSLTSSSNSTSPARCEGLDLLVKAVYCVVAGSVIGVPYIQRRVIRRRKRPIHFTKLIIGEFIKTGRKKPGEGEADSDQDAENLEGKRRKRRAKSALPSKYQDSVLHEWKPPRKKQRRSGKIGSGSGL